MAMPKNVPGTTERQYPFIQLLTSETGHGLFDPCQPLLIRTVSAEELANEPRSPVVHGERVFKQRFGHQMGVVAQDHLQQVLIVGEGPAVR